MLTLTQETRLTVLGDTLCSAFNSSQLLYREKVEFCAGNKIKFPQMRIYKRFRKRKDAGEGKQEEGKEIKYTFKELATKKNTVKKPTVW